MRRKKRHEIDLYLPAILRNISDNSTYPAGNHHCHNHRKKKMIDHFFWLIVTIHKRQLKDKQKETPCKGQNKGR